MKKVGPYKLEDLTTKIGSGATPKGGKNSYKKSGISLIRSLNIYDLKFDKDGLAFIDDEQAENLSNVEVEKDDVLINITGASVARCCKVPNDILPARVNQHVSILRPKKDQLNPDFLQYLLVSSFYKKKLLAYAQGGATREALTKGGLQDFEIDLPPIDTQNRISSILSVFDDLIKNNARRIEILEEMAQRIYCEWFVHFRYPGHEKDSLLDSGTDEFDKIPEGWGMDVIDQVLEHYIGGTWGQDEPEEEENNPAYVIRGTDIPGGRLGNVDNIPLRYHKRSYINSRNLQHGDIVFEVSGGSKDQPVGRAMLITDTFLSELNCDDVVHASFCKLLRSDKSILKPEILYLHIRKIYDDRRIMKYQVQSTGISNFKFTFFAKNKQVFIPPIELQEKFQEKISPLFEQMYILGKQINRLKETRDSLLPKLIFGKDSYRGKVQEIIIPWFNGIL